ncbi:MAG: arginine--tRNA ligase [Clostridia bacterium]|nr:arginine--tRNA ligase [Clostridia bacterium]
MLNFKKMLAEKLSEASKEYFPDADLSSVNFEEMFEYPPDNSMGDVALPCFKLSKTLRKAPPMISAALAGYDYGDSVASVACASGYLNFKISDKYLASSVLGDIEKLGDKYGSNELGKGKTAVFDYSSPNVAKPFHIGHLGTTVIGHSLKLLHEFSGFKCVGINYLGDWGTQFGKMICAFRLWGDKKTIEETGIDGLVALYVKFHEEAERDPSLEDAARAEFKKLEDGDEENISLWKWFVEISLKEYQITYKQLGIEFDSYKGESFYTDKMPEQVQKLRDMGLLKIDQGASIVDLEKYDMPPCLILKSDGTTLYPTRDIAAAVYRKNTYDFDKCIYVTSAQQILHFSQWFKVVELMGYDWYDKLVHVPYGTVSIDGEKLATRTGHVILLRDLFSTAIEKVNAVMDEKNPDLENRAEVAEAVGVGAVIFHYLLNSRIKDINFNMDAALSFEGNTGPYAQYTYARTCSVLSKAGAADHNAEIVITDPSESDLLKTLSLMPEKVLSALADYEPSVITRYVIDVCTAFNRFYHDCQILNANDEAVRSTRLRLTAAAGTVLKNALHLICLKTPEKI